MSVSQLLYRKNHTPNFMEFSAHIIYGAIQKNVTPEGVMGSDECDKVWQGEGGVLQCPMARRWKFL